MAELTDSFAKATLVNKGRMLKDPSKAHILLNAPIFTICTVPDLDMNTRIIAVCGATDVPTEIKIDDWDAPASVPKKTINTGGADPLADGWFLSDFYAFKHLVKGHGASQLWITAESPDYLVKKYKTYLHGNPYQERKIVLDAHVVAEGIEDNLHVAGRDELCTVFKEKLKQEAEAARKARQSLLVMIFGHGDEETRGMLLGHSVPDHLFHLTDFRTAVGDAIRTTLFTTACYSGGWVVHKDLNITMLAAAGPYEESHSWNASPSVGRYCGGVYSSALLEEWRAESKRAEDEAGNSKAVNKHQQEKSYAAFTEGVYNTLFKIYKFASTQDIRFGAQDDDWESAWGERTGMPLVNFQARWDCLQTVTPTADPESSLNQHPSTAATGVKPPTRTGSLRARYSSLSSATRHIQMSARIYLESTPGRDNVASNTGLHAYLHKLLAGRITDPISLHTLYNQLEFRIGLMKVATRSLHTACIPLPLGRECAEFDVEEFERKVRAAPDELESRKYWTARDKVSSNVLPNPDETTQGRRWNKPHRYICAALATDSSINTPEKLEAAVKRLEKGMPSSLCSRCNAAC